MRSKPLEALKFAPALTEADVFYLSPFLSCIDAHLHRRHGERHLGVTSEFIAPEA